MQGTLFSTVYYSKQNAVFVCFALFFRLTCTLITDLNVPITTHTHYMAESSVLSESEWERKGKFLTQGTCKTIGKIF